MFYLFKKKNFLKYIFFIVVYFLSVPCVHADSVGVNVDQSIFAFSGDPGTNQKITINVKNTSSVLQRMSAVPKDFVAGDNNEITNVIASNEQFGMKDWILTDEKNWILNPGETKNINFSVSIPEEAAVGAHYSIVDIRAFPEIDGQNFQSTIVGGQVGVYFLLNVNGSSRGSGEIKNFDAPILAGKDISLKTDFENTGNILYIPHGKIKIQNIVNKKITTIETEKHFVFPGKKYSFEADWNQGSILGAYKAEANFADANGEIHVESRFIFGKLFFIFPVIIFGILACFYVRLAKKVKEKREFNIERVC